MKLFIATCSAALLSMSVTAFAESNQYYYSKNGTQYQQRNERVFIFNPRDNHWAAYENGRKVASGIANGGAPDGHETPTGVFYVHDKKGPDYLSSKYPINDDGTRGGAQMPYAMHFTNSGHAIHGSPGVSKQNSSHGCIRVKTAYAKWLNESFITPSTKIIVYPY